MAYRYEATEDERAAAALLRDKGWSVNKPSCPLCHGFGTVGKAVTWDLPGVHSMSTSTWTTSPCPNGCPVPAMYYQTSTAFR